MEDPHHVDDALELAIERTIAAQDTFEATPLSAPEVVPAAHAVVRRADDVRALAEGADAAVDAEHGSEGRPGSRG